MCINRKKLDLKDQMSKMSSSMTNSECSKIRNANCNTAKVSGRVLQNIQQEQKYPELSMRSFFEFMRTAYGVNENFEELVNTVSTNSEIDWNALARTDLNSDKTESQSSNAENAVPKKQPKEINKTEDSKCAESVRKSSESGVQSDEASLSKDMKKHLSEVLHEGLLDSVLPYMIPRTVQSETVIKKSPGNSEARKSISLGDNRELKLAKEKEAPARRKSFDCDIEIHVCDEAKNVKKDFRCPQRLLIQNMCYFADVTAGQKLEEMDISVHCDIVIFDWLMRWVKRDIIKKSEWPVLEASNVVPIMVSASFLQMQPLLNSCLLYCHDHMSDILKTCSVLSCLNDNLLTRLADLFTNAEVETVKDRKDKIQSKLFCKLIMSLANPVADNSKGHFSTLATMFRCSKCQKMIVRSVSDAIPCVPSCMRIDNQGELHSKHARHLTWNLDDYIISLRSQLGSWRHVYWRLWGDCHFLFCRLCDTYFPVNQMDWCAFHPENPQFFVNEQQKNIAYPIGRFPCCSQRTFRFELVTHTNGCRFKEHIPKVTTKQEEEILEIFSSFRDLIATQPPHLYFPEKITRLVPRDPDLESGKLISKHSCWWEGIELAAARPKLGLLGKIWGSRMMKKSCLTPTKQRKIQRQESRTTDGSTPVSSITESDDDRHDSECETSNDEDSYNSEESKQFPDLTFIQRQRSRHRSTKKRYNGNGAWNSDLTIRSNQDNQREYEEKVTKQMIALLTKRTNVQIGMTQKSKSNKHSWNNVQPLGGTYVKLEAEFRELLAQTYKNKNLSANSTRNLRSAK